MTDIVDLADPAACARELTGGKGANLARMAQAGFPVPRAFVVTTEAYGAVFGAGFEARAADLLGAIDFGDAASVEAGARRIRELVAATPVPTAIADAIAAACAGLGADHHVAVRSSGTAEDLAEASFAGQHDTYLDIRGVAAVLDAVRRCWASLWTARAVAYRHANHVGESTKVRLAVVVQEMVDAEAAGVLFTANPLTRATDEVVINAAWGLGEGVVSGRLTPDQIRVHKRTRSLLAAVTGSKEVRFVRDPATGQGTVEQATAAEERSHLCLTPPQVDELVRLGLEVERHYGGMPQDVEWAYAGGRFHLLQARDVTGVEFAWDEEVDAWQTLPDEPEVIWTRGFADEYWTGAITPLFYSVRAREHTASYYRSARLWGIPALARTRIFRYREAEAYLSTQSQALQIERLLPKMFRNGPALAYLPPSMRARVAAAPFPVLGWLRMYARIAILDRRHGVRGWIETTRQYMAQRVEEAEGLDDDGLERLSDADLERYVDARMEFMAGLLEVMWSGFQLHGASALYLLGAVLARWYDGDNAMVYADLITGLPQRTLTMEENLALWDLAALIRRDEALLGLFRTSDAREFFQRLGEHPAGGAAVALYRRLVEEHGHRGHADRDFYYPRRAEDPAIDYRSLKALLGGGGERPDIMEARLAAQREAAVADVVGRLRRGPFGALRVALFRRLHAYVLDFLVVRDDERHYLDRLTLSKKRAFLELGRRLRERGVLARDDDFHFLTREELFEALEGRSAERLMSAKIAGRRRHFDRFLSKAGMPPLYVRGNEVFVDAGDCTAAPRPGEALCGMPTSRGSVSGRARIVLELGGIGTLERGDILITNSTDPGWTPVFSLIGGLVLETGGMLSHGACLSREYNLPAVTLADAAKLIRDGAWVTLDGDTGEVRVVDEHAAGVDGVKGENTGT